MCHSIPAVSYGTLCPRFGHPVHCNIRRGSWSNALLPVGLLLWLLWVFCLQNLHDLTPKYWDIIVGRCPHNIPLHRKVRMDSNVTECNNIAPFHLRVRLSKGVWETGYRFTNHRQLLEGGGLMEFAHQER